MLNTRKSQTFILELALTTKSDNKILDGFKSDKFDPLDGFKRIFFFSKFLLLKSGLI